MNKSRTKTQRAPEIVVSTVWDQKGLPKISKRSKATNSENNTDKRLLYPASANSESVFSESFRKRLKGGFLFVAKNGPIMIYLDSGDQLEIKTGDIVMSLGAINSGPRNEKMQLLYFDKTWVFEPNSLMHKNFFNHFEKQETR